MKNIIFISKSKEKKSRKPYCVLNNGKKKMNSYFFQLKSIADCSLIYKSIKNKMCNI